MKVTADLINKAGVAAINTYLECAGAGFSEDSVSERSLSAFMALQLHNLAGLHAIPEVPYTRMVDDLQMKIEEPARAQIVGLRADIGLYDSGQPVAVVELKILSCGSDALFEFARDLRKGDPVSLSKRIRIYATALICQTVGRSLDDQKVWVEKGIGQPLRYSSTEPTSTGQNWQWCFGCTE